MKKSSMFIYLFTCLFIYLIFVYLIDFIQPIRQVLEFRSIASQINNVFCSRCWLAKRFKTLSDKLMLIGQTFLERKTRLIGNSFCHFIG